MRRSMHRRTVNLQTQMPSKSVKGDDDRQYSKCSNVCMRPRHSGRTEKLSRSCWAILVCLGQLFVSFRNAFCHALKQLRPDSAGHLIWAVSSLWSLIAKDYDLF